METHQECKWKETLQKYAPDIAFWVFFLGTLLFLFDGGGYG